MLEVEAENANSLKGVFIIGGFLEVNYYISYC